MRCDIHIWIFYKQIVKCIKKCFDSYVAQTLILEFNSAEDTKGIYNLHKNCFRAKFRQPLDYNTFLFEFEENFSVNFGVFDPQDKFISSHLFL